VTRSVSGQPSSRGDVVLIDVRERTDTISKHGPRTVAVAASLVAILALSAPAASAGPRDGWASAGGRRSLVPTRMQQPPNTLPGIDVSHWQNDIDWAKVASSGVRFVFMKATEGRTFDDPNYAAYRAGALAAGLVVTAYHFANPGPGPNDPILEADHFVDVAGIDSGNIIPVLDLERTGGLGPAELIAWTFAWLQEVTARTNVMPMIYSGPHFWRTNMDDTSAFADAGYREWIAHWFVASPDVPAADWGGHGWTFWQWTDCKKVPGISGCVDADWFNGTDLGAVTVHRLTVSLATPQGAVASVPGPISCGTTCSSLFDPGAGVTLTPTPSPGAVFIGWGGSCSGTGPCVVTMDADRTVTATFGYQLSVTLAGVGTGRVTSAPAGIDCGSICTGAFASGTSVTLTATPDSGMEFAGWSGACAGTGPCVVTMDEAQSVTATFIDDTPPSVTIAAPSSLTGSVTATFDEIVHGVNADNMVLRGGQSGANLPAALACVSPKGASVDCATGNVVRVVLRPAAPLVLGQHYTAVVDPPGAPAPVVDRGGNPAPTTEQAFDAPGAVEQASRAVRFGWPSVRSPSAIGGSYLVEHLAGAKVAFAFTGSSVTWYTVAGPSQGIASVSVDGRFRGTFDQYAPTPRFGVAHTFSGLGPGPHTIAIAAQGRGAPSAVGTEVAVDAFRTGAGLFPTPGVTASWRPVRTGRASGGSYAESDLAGASVSVRFRGTGVDWYSVGGPDRGRARVFVDGRLVRTVDEYAPTLTYDVRRHIGGLADAVHTLRIVVLGASRSSARGTLVTVDRFVVP
jgi:GH25 family lysozyme M1 (1,4-beta-N-acetylmuramidase)